MSTRAPLRVSGSRTAFVGHGRSPSLPVLACSVSLLAGLLYLNALHNPFVYDDYRLIVENPSILDLQDLRGIVYRDMTRPLVNLSFAADVFTWGREPFGFHLTNVLLHMLNVGLVLYLVWLLADDRSRQRGQVLPSASSIVVATTSALLLAVHPLMTQAVGYVSGRSEVLYVTFFLLAFLAARQWFLHGSARWWLTAVGLWMLALLAKETAVMFGVVLFCYDRLVLGGDPAVKRRRLLTLHLPVFSMALLAGIARIGVLTRIEYPDQSSGDWRFALVAIDSVWRYLRLIILPRGQSVFHDVPAIADPLSSTALVSLAGLATIMAVAWRLRRLQSLVAFGLLWFVLLLVPSGVLFALGRGEPMAEHRVYGASIGIFIAAGSAFGLLWRRFHGRGPLWRGLLYGLSALFVAQLCGRTVVRNAVWGDPVMLSREAVDMAPDHWIPRLLLAEAFRTTGRCDEAIVEYARAIALRPREEFGYVKLAACLVDGGRLDDAYAAFEKLEQINPSSAQASAGMGLVDLLRDRPRDARRQFQRAIERNSSAQNARLFLSFVDGTLSEAETEGVCAELVRLFPPFKCRPAGN